MAKAGLELGSVLFQPSPYSRIYCFPLGKFCLTCSNSSTGGCRESKPFNIYLWDWLLCSAKWPRVPKRVLALNLPKSASVPPPAGCPRPWVPAAEGKVVNARLGEAQDEQWPLLCCKRYAWVLTSPYSCYKKPCKCFLYLRKSTNSRINSGGGGGGGGLVAQSCPTLAIPWTVAHQAPLSVGFPRQEYWCGVPFSRGSSRPRDWICIPFITGRFFTNEPPGKNQQSCVQFLNVFEILVYFPWASVSIFKIEITPANRFITTIFSDSIYMC